MGTYTVTFYARCTREYQAEDEDEARELAQNDAWDGECDPESGWDIEDVTYEGEEDWVG